MIINIYGICPLLVVYCTMTPYRLLFSYIPCTSQTVLRRNVPVFALSVPPSVRNTSSSTTSAHSVPLTSNLRPSSFNQNNERPQPAGRRTYLTALACGLVGYGLALIYPPTFYKLVFPKPIPWNPRPDSPEGIAATKIIEDQIQSLPLVQQLREASLDEDSFSPNTTNLTHEQTSRPRRWKESRPYSKVPIEKKKHSLTQYALRGPGMFAVPPILFSSKDEKESIGIIHVGNALCGHNGIVHGGLLATILDEAVARPVSISM